jgi:hypothetical protein
MKRYESDEKLLIPHSFALQLDFKGNLCNIVHVIYHFLASPLNSLGFTTVNTLEMLKPKCN